MKNIEIFDPAMCCETGVCGPSIDTELIRIATAINSLKEQGIIITRHGLSNDPQAFVTNQVISDILNEEGAEVLPITLVDGEVAKKREYPTNAELAEWLGVEIKPQRLKKISQRCSCGCGPKGCC